MEGKYLLVAQVPCKDEAAKKELIEKYIEEAEHCRKNVSGCHKFAIFTNRNDPSDLTVWSFEQFTDKATAEAHLQTDVVKDIISWFQTRQPVAGDLTVLKLAVDDEFSVPTRAEADTHEDPFVALGVLTYKDGTVPESLPYWKEVVAVSAKEEGTLSYGIYKNTEDKNKVVAWEVYTSKEYLYDVHAKSDAVQQNVKNTGHLREGLKHTFLKKVGGFLKK